MNTEKIEYPSDTEIQMQIQQIIKKGVTPQKSVFRMLKDMTTNIGIPVIFHGITDIFAIVMMIAVGLELIFLQASDGFILIKPEIDLEEMVFTFAPLFYIACYFLSYAKEKQSDLYEIKMVCKYDIRYLIGFRMVWFSFFSLLLNLIFFGLPCVLNNSYASWNFVAISLCSLLIFAVLLTVSLRWGKRRFGPAFVTVAWVAVNYGTMVLAGELYGEFLRAVPPFVYLFITVLLFAVYLQQLKKFMIMKRNKGVLC